MKIFNYTLGLVSLLSLILSCSSKIYHYKVEEFPMLQADAASTSADVGGHVAFFKDSIYVMRIYEIDDTFSNDERQKYINHRSVSKSEEVALHKLTQTLCLVFLDSQRVLYYTMLQDNPALLNPKTADYPSKICLTDKVTSKDLTLDRCERRHFYHGVYKWTSDHTLQIEFQKNYDYVKLKSAKKKRKAERRKRQAIEEKKKRFVRFWCSIDSAKNITIDTLAYREDNILSENSEARLSAKKILGAKFHTVFVAIPLGSSMATVYSPPNRNIDYEIEADFANNLGFRNFKKGEAAEKLTPLKVEELSKYTSKLKDSADARKKLTEVMPYQVERCVIKFPFLKNDTSDFITIRYKLKNQAFISQDYKLSPILIAKIKQIKSNKKIKAIAINENDSVVVQDNKFSGFFNIYELLDKRNKADFLNLLKTISVFDHYRLRVYKDSTWEGFVENTLVTINMGASSVKYKYETKSVKAPNPLSITYKLETESFAIPQIKKCFGAAKVYTVRVEHEFKIDSIVQALDSGSLVSFNKYYLKDTAISEKRLVFYDLNLNGSFTYIPNWEKEFRQAECESLRALFNRIDDIKYFIKYFENQSIEHDDKGYYIKELVTGKKLTTW